MGQVGISLREEIVMKRKSLSELVADVLHAKRFEPEMRNHDGMRHHGHRFPIKGGISGFEVMARNIEKNNPLFQRLKKGD